MLRNCLITHLSQHDDDTVVVMVNGVPVDVEAVTKHGQFIAVQLDQDALSRALQRATGTPPAAEPTS